MIIRTDEFIGSANFPHPPTAWFASRVAPVQPTDAEALAKAVAEGACYPAHAREFSDVSWKSDENGFYACIYQYNTAVVEDPAPAE